MIDNSRGGLIDTRTRDAILADLPATVDAIVDAVTESGPSYKPLFASDRAIGLRLQIDVALRTFLRLAFGQTHTTTNADDDLMRPALDAAFAMGRDQAVGGRDTETLLTAFRVGARTAWHEFAATATRHGMSAAGVADLAELIFDFIDQLSAGTVAGHQHQVSRSMQVREQERALLARELVLGLTPGEDRLRRAEWQLPESVTIAVVRDADLARLREHLGKGALVADGAFPIDTPRTDPSLVLVLVPDLSARDRQRLLGRLSDVRCILGPTVEPAQAPRSLRWAARLWGCTSTAGALDVDDHLLDVVVHAEPEAVELLRRRLLAGLDDLSEDARQRLELTLACWLNHRGRYDRVAAELHLHPQTVRYRIAQVHSRIGEVLTDPAHDFALQLALRCTDLPPV